MKYALCTIVKNEEKMIEGFILNVQKFFDEIVIVDTGSEDSTIEIIKKNGIEPIIYNNNKFSYSQARNYGINTVNADWIFLLDADERITEDYFNTAIKLLEKMQCDVLCSWRYDYLKSGEWGGNFSPRIIRNYKNINFVGDILEFPASKTNDDILIIDSTEVQIHHFGNLKEEKFLQSKYLRYEKEVSNLINNTADKRKISKYMLFLSSINYCLGNKKTSLNIINSCIDKGELDSWSRRKMAGDILRLNGLDTEAIEQYKASLSYTDDKNKLAITNDLIGVSSMNKGSFEESIAYFNTAIESFGIMPHRFVLLGLAQLSLDLCDDAIYNINKGLAQNPYFKHMTHDSLQHNYIYDTPKDYCSLIKSIVPDLSCWKEV